MPEVHAEIRGAFWCMVALFAVFLVLPMLCLFGESLGGAEGVFAHYAALAESPRFQTSLGNSFLVSGLAALITTVLAFFLAYTLHNTGLPDAMKKFIANMTLAPMFLPTITYGFVLIYAFGREGLITRLLGFQPFEIYGMNGLLAGYVVYTLPIAFLLVNNTFKYVDKNFAVVSKIMGDTPIRTFLVTAVRPLTGTLGAAFIQAFTLCFTDFGIPASIGGQFDVVAIHLYNEMLGSIPNFAGGAAIAMVMLLPSVASIALVSWLERYNFRYSKISQTETQKNPWRDALCGSFSLLLIFLIVAVFAVMFVVPFVRNWPYDTSFTLENWGRLLGSPNLLGIYGHSLLVAFLSALGGTVAAYAAAVVAARSTMGKAAQGLMNGIAVVTNAVPGMVLGIAYVFAFSGTCLRNTFAVLILCNIVHLFTTPYLMAKGSLEKMNRGWESTAALMGDSWWKTLVRVLIPNSLPSILDMFGYYFINSMITISAVIFLVGAHTGVLTTKIKELQHFAKFDEIFVMSLLILLTNIAIRFALSKAAHQRG